MSEIVTVRKQGASKVVALTGFVELGEHYSVNKNGDIITLKKLKEE